MKKSIILGAIVYVLLTAAGLAQTEWQEKGRIKVPSAFVVGHTTLPAGTYLVSENTATHQLMFTNVKSSGVGSRPKP